MDYKAVLEAVYEPEPQAMANIRGFERHGVIDTGWIAPVPDGAGNPVRDTKPPFGLAQQEQAAIGGQSAAIESGREFLEPDGWQSKR